MCVSKTKRKKKKGGRTFAPAMLSLSSHGKGWGRVAKRGPPLLLDLRFTVRKRNNIKIEWAHLARPPLSCFLWKCLREKLRLQLRACDVGDHVINAHLRLLNLSFFVEESGTSCPKLSHETAEVLIVKGISLL